jgi:hypothetical protein
MTEYERKLEAFRAKVETDKADLYNSGIRFSRGEPPTVKVERGRIWDKVQYVRGNQIHDAYMVLARPDRIKIRTADFLEAGTIWRVTPYGYPDKPVEVVVDGRAVRCTLGNFEAAYWGGNKPIRGKE